MLIHDLAAAAFDPAADPQVRQRAVALVDDPDLLARLALDESAPAQVRAAAADRLSPPTGEDVRVGRATTEALAAAGTAAARAAAARLAAQDRDDHGWRSRMLRSLAQDDSPDVSSAAAAGMRDPGDLLWACANAAPGHRTAAALAESLNHLRWSDWFDHDRAEAERLIFAAACQPGRHALAAALIDPAALAVLGHIPTAADRLTDLLGHAAAQRALADPAAFVRDPLAAAIGLGQIADGLDPDLRGAALDLLLRHRNADLVLADQLGDAGRVEHREELLHRISRAAVQDDDPGAARRARRVLHDVQGGSGHLIRAVLDELGSGLTNGTDAEWDRLAAAAGDPDGALQRALAETPLLHPARGARAAAASLLLDPWALALLVRDPDPDVHVEAVGRLAALGGSDPFWTTADRAHVRDDPDGFASRVDRAGGGDGLPPILRPDPDRTPPGVADAIRAWRDAAADLPPQAGEAEARCR